MRWPGLLRIIASAGRTSLTDLSRVAPSSGLAKIQVTIPNLASVPIWGKSHGGFYGFHCVFCWSSSLFPRCHHDPYLTPFCPKVQLSSWGCRLVLMVPQQLGIRIRSPGVAGLSFLHLHWLLISQWDFRHVSLVSLVMNDSDLSVETDWLQRLWNFLLMLCRWLFIN